MFSLNANHVMLTMLVYIDANHVILARLVYVNGFLSFQQKQSKDRFGLEGDEESTMLEESVSPKK